MFVEHVPLSHDAVRHCHFLSLPVDTGVSRVDRQRSIVWFARICRKNSSRSTKSTPRILMLLASFKSIPSKLTEKFVTFLIDDAVPKSISSVFEGFAFRPLEVNHADSSVRSAFSEIRLLRMMGPKMLPWITPYRVYLNSSHPDKLDETSKFIN